MRRRYRVLSWVAAALLALPLLLAAVVYVFANTAPGRTFIEQTTASLTHGTVQLTGLAGHFPDQLQLKRLELRDPQGLWLSIEDVRLQWSPSALLFYRADVALLSAVHVDMPRAPAYPSDHKPSSPHHWPLVRVQQLDVQRTDLGAPLTGSAVAFELKGDGTWVSLQQASLQLEARRLDSVPSLYRASAQFDAQRLQAQLDLQEDADGPLAHLAQIPTIGALSIHLTLAGPRESVTTALQLTAGALSASAAGTIDARTGAANLNLSVDADAMSPRPGIAWKQVHLKGQWQGAIDAPVTNAELEATGVIVPGVQLPALSATLSGQGGTLNLETKASGLSVAGKVGALLAATPITAHATMHLDQPGHPIDLTAAHALLSASGRWSGNGADGGATLNATINDLRPFAALISQDLNGRATLEAQLHTRPESTRLELSSVLAVTGGLSPLAPLLGPKATFNAAISFDPQGMDLSRAQLASGRLTAALQGRYGSDGMDLSWELSLSDLAVLSPRLAGNASAQGALKGLAPRLALTADVDGQVGINGTKSGALHLKLSARDLPQRPTGNLTLTGTLDQAPIVVDASLKGEADGALEATLDRGSWKSLHALGQLHVPGGKDAPGGQIELDMAHLEDLANLLGQPLQGSVNARADFDGSAPGGRARVRIDARDAGLPAQQLSVLHLSGNIDSLTSTPTLSLQLSTRTLIRNVPANLRAKVQGPLSAIALQVSAATEGDETTQSEVNASAVFDGGQHALRVSALELKYRGEEARLLSPLVLSFADGLAVDRLRLGVGNTVLEAQGRISPTLDLTASLHDITSDLLHPWLPNAKADGKIDVDVELHGSADQPTGSVHVVGRGLRAHSGSVRGLPAGNLTIDAQLQQSVAQLSVEADVGERLALHISGQAPLNRSAPIALKASGTFDLVLLNPILEAGGQRLQGQAKLDADVGGTLADPQARGSVELTHGDIQDFPRGLHLTNVSAVFSANGDQVKVENFIAHAGPGTLSANGSLGLSGAMPLSLKVEARNARPLASDLITANVDLDLSVSGPLRQKLDAVGSLHVLRADLNIPNALPPSVAVLDVRKPGQKVLPPRPSTFDVALNLSVDAPRAVFVRGRGLDSELGGSLHVGGTASDPSISGGFDLRKGTINLAGSTLTFTSGRLSFNGSGVKKKIDPTLDFTATNISNGVTYTLNVGGFADAPVITLSSSPEQPQDQILARLLFSADPAQLSTLQIAQIAAALATMSGVGGNGLNPLTAVQRKLRLDRLAISGSSSTTGPTTAAGTSAQGTSTAASIEAGRYVSSRVFVGGKQFTSGTTQAEVQVDLTKSLKIQTTLATGGGSVQGETPQNDPGSSVGLSYQFEY